MVEACRRYGLYAAWLISIVAVGGSLFFSEVRMFVPCNLCWWQRIVMYPLVPILGIASWLDDAKVVRYVLPLAWGGFLLSTYHYLGQKVDGFLPPAVCTGGAPCDMQYINWLGFITIPFLAGVAFLLIAIILTVKAVGDRNAATTRPGV